MRSRPDTPIGLEAKTSWTAASGPDEIVIGMVAARIGQPEPRTGSSSTGSPARCRRPRHSIELLKEKGLKLDAVIELRVNEAVLLQRVETQIAEMLARGEAVRADDNAEALAKRLAKPIAPRPSRWCTTTATNGRWRPWMAWRRSTR